MTTRLTEFNIKVIKNIYVSWILLNRARVLIGCGEKCKELRDKFPRLRSKFDKWDIEQGITLKG